MPQIYPSLEIIKEMRPVPTEGELFLINYLVEGFAQLECSTPDNPKWEIFFQPFLNGDRPDIIILNKKKGAYIIEVKDYNLDAYEYQPDDTKQSYGSLVIKNAKHTAVNVPHTQVERYKSNLYNTYSTILSSAVLDNASVYGCIKTGIFFYNSDRSKAKAKFSKCKHQHVNYIAIWGREDAEDIANKINYGLNPKPFKETLFKEIYYTEIRRIIDPGYNEIERNQKVSLNSRQESLSISKPNTKTTIKGVPGSGKTLVLAKRAVNAVNRTNKQVLVLCYNITLTNYIKDNISRFRKEASWSNFYVVHFHLFIAQQINEYTTLTIEEVFTAGEEDIINLECVKQAFEEIKDNIIKYDTILIDEVQDFDLEWLEFITRFFLHDKGEYVLFGDEKQNIYKRKQENKQMRTNVKGRPNTLTSSYRLSESIVNLTNKFQKEFFSPEKYNINIIKPVEQSSLFDTNTLIEYVNLGSDPQKLMDYISDCIKKFNIVDNDVCIVGNNIELMRKVEEQYLTTHKYQKTSTTFETEAEYNKIVNFRDKNYQEIKLGEVRRTKKYNFRLNGGSIKLSTMQSFKGWEAHTLFLILDKTDISCELIYTSITRCRNRLFIINIENETYHEFFSNYDNGK
ncbi:MAG: hypothetical protein BEN19_06505 [Epulopiscium sp. Nuni2H_MBin003]|nr:MAG: hypothetical protein BEN19_06505 [Epulopiscium sp. Nuni2H_MBin003]